MLKRKILHAYFKSKNGEDTYRGAVTAQYADGTISLRVTHALNANGEFVPANISFPYIRTEGHYWTEWPPK